jgi:hypothetical protein
MSKIVDRLMKTEKTFKPPTHPESFDHGHAVGWMEGKAIGYGVGLRTIDGTFPNTPGGSNQRPEDELYDEAYEAGRLSRDEDVLDAYGAGRRVGRRECKASHTN